MRSRRKKTLKGRVAKKPGSRKKSVTVFRKAFIKKLSYDFRIPLHSIIGFSEWVGKGKAGAINKKQKEYLRDIVISAKNLLKILDSSMKKAGKER